MLTNKMMPTPIHVTIFATVITDIIMTLTPYGKAYVAYTLLWSYKDITWFNLSFCSNIHP